VLRARPLGGANVTPAAEFNIWADPEAARRVFSSGLDLTMVGLDVTTKALLTSVDAQRLAGTGAAGALLADLHAFYARHHRRRHSGGGGPVHDAVAVAHLIDPSLMERERCGVRVD